MTILSNARSYDWGTWLVGIMRSLVSGGAGAVAGMTGPMIQDPKDWNLAGGLHNVLVSMGIGFVVGAVTHLAVFLQTHGAPEAVVPNRPV